MKDIKELQKGLGCAIKNGEKTEFERICRCALKSVLFGMCSSSSGCSFGMHGSRVLSGGSSSEVVFVFLVINLFYRGDQELGRGINAVQWGPNTVLSFVIS